MSGRLGLSGLAALGCSCTGPSLHLDNPGHHPVFVDGVATSKPVLPFRYYGTTRWDALPADRTDGDPDFDHLPQSQPVSLPPPASPWLFPLDFPLELLDRLLHGRGDTFVAIAVPNAPEELRGDIEIRPQALGELSARARAARIER